MIRQADFPVSLVFPPQGHFTQPYLALPCLKAHLASEGFGDVELIDASIEAYDRFLSADYLAAAAERVDRRLALSSFEGREQLAFEDLEAFRAAAESAVSAASLIDEVEDAKAVVRGEAFWDADRYVPAVRTLYHGLRLVSASWFPSQLTPHNFTMRYANDHSDQVLAATLDEAENPFIEHFRATLLPRLVARRPRVVGLSVIYGSQLIPALTLGRMIKQALPDCHVTAGGGFLAYIGEKLMGAPGIGACLDSIIFHEGEAPLAALCHALREQPPGTAVDLSEIGSLLWFDRRDGAAHPVRNAPAHPIKLDEAPIPDFDGLPFEKYFSPEVVIPYDINRGCYYGECAFCTLPTVIGPGYRTRSAAHIVDHVLALKERYGVRHFNFITDCMPPGMIADLPTELIEREADIRWWCDARVEPKAYDREGAERLYESGCRKLLFGFETATPRLLKMMQKGQSLKSTVQVAENCAAAGISVTFYAMVGFPSETREEARATLDFLRQHAGTVREVSLQTFHIDEVALTYRDPERFGIRILDEPGADLQLYHDYESESGMTQNEAAEMFDEMMSGLRASLPLFSGDNIFWFMQKSHYFLHLARDVKPDAFERACAERTARRAAGSADPSLRVVDSLELVELPFRYGEVIETLGHPLARAVRPDFLTGRFVAGARDEAAAVLGSIAPRPSVLAYAGGGATEFVGLTADGARVLEAIAEAGDYGALRASLQDQGEAALAKLDAFATELNRLGLLRVPTADPSELSPAPGTPRRSSATPSNAHSPRP
ncbi:B12-binding domain-containing radical SAM protein [Engelhardtia mirabilis]|uniref:Ribosomal protein S12 methylthiotransferase RimO n=1 Tax=Engelhardtia mirabilis TaxID=2528011 RepID=A0A518BNB4_9BACT|nr:Ribosomal protein S12 methylthiotransferase RimO [Planctomycetes bacterium Pla133]QDV02795.1 Ribosomal protein S12 methylthiotransferase RimO [Planctomycetes bacterium Pla86]